MSFADQVKRFTRDYQKRLERTARTAVQDLEGEITATRGEGGRLRVDTGFLRASLGWGLGSMPAGPTDGEGSYSANDTLTGDPLPVALAKWDFSQPLYGGFSANYARPREYKDGFVRGGTEKWDTIVESAARRVKARS
jgi:hypothetical protein